jgi:hypothetical protein
MKPTQITHTKERRAIQKDDFLLFPGGRHKAEQEALEITRPALLDLFSEDAGKEVNVPTLNALLLQ